MSLKVKKTNSSHERVALKMLFASVPQASLTVLQSHTSQS